MAFLTVLNGRFNMHILYSPTPANYRQKYHAWALSMYVCCVRVQVEDIGNLHHVV